MVKKILSVLLMVTMITGYVFFLRAYEKEEKNSLPEIVFDSDHLVLSVSDDDSRLMEGVHAYDEEDGDLTDQIIVDSVSVFDSDYYRTVKYVVFDKNNKAAVASRTISYTDYTPPRIYLKDSLVQDTISTTSLNRIIGAVSSVDGDISNSTELKCGTFQNNRLDVKVSVSDSTGTESTISFTCDYDRTVYLADIVLNQYLLYIPVGTEYDFLENINDIVIINTSRPDLLEQVIIQSSVDFYTPGIYEVYYYLSGDTGSSARVKGLVLIQ